MSQNHVKLGIAQYASVHLDLSATLQKLQDIAGQAATQKLELLVFGETWLSGYPAWIDHCPEIAFWDHTPTKNAYVQLRESAVEVPGKETQLIAGLAKKHKMAIVIGVNEKVTSGPGHGTLYNSLLIFDERGNLANHHRKLMPTFTEKMLYGLGDGHGLQAVDTSSARIGGLICWEHWMPLTRQALHNSGEQIHVALWPNVHEKLQLASRHYAFEGRCFVLAAGQLLKAEDFPKDLSLPEKFQNDPQALALRGGSAIIGPDGEYLVEPVFDREALLIAEIDLQQAIKEQMTLDVTGHYQRNDVFRFELKSQEPR